MYSVMLVDLKYIYIYMKRQRKIKQNTIFILMQCVSFNQEALPSLLSTGVFQERIRV